MKRIYSTKWVVRLAATFLFAVTLFIIHSCRKDIHSNQPLTTTDIGNAKSWFESTYPLDAGKGNIQIAGVNNLQNQLYKIVRPDWDHLSSYTRFNKKIVELPLDKSAQLGFTFNKNSFSFNKNTSKSSFLILNDGQSYTAYIMTILADSSYLQNDYSKLDRNSYNKRDANFSGFVFYSSPSGDLIKGWHYLNGKINRAISPNASSPTGGMQVQSLQPSRKTVLDDGCTDGIISVFAGTYCVSAGDSDPVCTDYFRDEPIWSCDDRQSLPPDDDPGGGGNGGFPDPTPPPTVINDPCATAKAATGNTDFNGKISDLRGYTSNTSGEHGWIYSQNSDGSFSYKSLGSTSDPNQINPPTNAIIANLLHNHFTGQLSNFSAADINSVFAIYSGKLMSNTTTFTSTVVTPSGVYMLTISDPDKFKTFAQNGASESGFQRVLDIYGYSESNTADANDAILSKVLATLNGGTGLSLLKQDTNGKFNVLTNVNNQLTTTNCN